MLAAIGDIHGESGKLDRLIVELEQRLASEDTFLFIGDYIDRGPDSKGVVDRILDLGTRRTVIALRGNHEQMMLDALEFFRPSQGGKKIDGESAMTWFYNGAPKTLESYPADLSDRWWERIPEEHWNFYRETLMEYASGNYLFVHAGVVPPNVKWKETEYDPRLWIRESFIESKMDFGKIVVFGHTPIKSGIPMIEINKIGIDTGAVFGGPLTAVILDLDRPYNPAEVEIVQSR